MLFFHRNNDAPFSFRQTSDNKQYVTEHTEIRNRWPDFGPYEPLLPIWLIRLPPHFEKWQTIRPSCLGSTSGHEREFRTSFLRRGFCLRHQKVGKRVIWKINSIPSHPSLRTRKAGLLLPLIFNISNSKHIRNVLSPHVVCVCHSEPSVVLHQLCSYPLKNVNSTRLSLPPHHPLIPFCIQMTQTVKHWSSHLMDD